MADDAEHLLICLLAICIFSSENVYSDNLPIFNFFFIFYYWVGRVMDVCCVSATQLCPNLLKLPWTVAHQSPLSMGFSRQDWYGLSFPSPADLPNPGSNSFFLGLLHWQADSLPLCPLGIPKSPWYILDKMKWIEVKVAQPCLTLRPHGLYSPWNSQGQNTGVSSLSLLQGIFPTHGLNPGLLHCRPILYQLRYKGSPIILEWVAYPFSSGSSWPRNRSGVSCTAGGYLTNWAIREVKMIFSDMWFVKMLFPPLGYLFIFFMALKNKSFKFL